VELAQRPEFGRAARLRVELGAQSHMMQEKAAAAERAAVDVAEVP